MTFELLLVGAIITIGVIGGLVGLAMNIGVAIEDYRLKKSLKED